MKENSQSESPHNKSPQEQSKQRKRLKKAEAKEENVTIDVTNKKSKLNIAKLKLLISVSQIKILFRDLSE